MIQITIRLLLSIFLAGLIGLEREKQEKAAGLRTMMLISLSAALLSIISLNLPKHIDLVDVPNLRFDVGRIIAYMIAGIGFLGSGIIIKRNNSKKNMVEGLTTASCLWGVLAIGILCGLNMIELAIITTLLILGILKMGYSYKKKK